MSALEPNLWSQPETEPLLSLAPELAAEILSWQESNPIALDMCSERESRPQLDVESTSTTRTNPDRSPATEPMAERERNPVAALESESPQRAAPQPNFANP